METDRRSALVTAALAATAALTLPPVSHAQRPARKDLAEEFDLTVRFDTPQTHGVELRVRLHAGQPFAVEAPRIKGGLVALSGMLLSPVGNRHPLVLSVLDYASDTSHTLGATLLHLTPGRPEGWGSIQSAVHAYTATLTRVAAP